MPTLFISYKRGTAAVAPLMERLKAAHYRLWYDKDDIHTGDNWREAIDQGVDHAQAIIVCLTPQACKSEFVQYEVSRAQQQHKPIFPVKMEAIDEAEDLKALGLPDIQFIDFTVAASDAWDKAFLRLCEDMIRNPALRVTRHDLRRIRYHNNSTYTLHQQYLTRLVERIGTLNLAQIAPEQSSGISLEQVYIDSPTHLKISVEVQDWKVVDWWITSPGGFSDDFSDEFVKTIPHRPTDLGYETAALEALIPDIEAQIEEYRKEWPNETPTDSYNSWKNGSHKNVLTLHVQDIAAARDRLVVLGTPGSGKSTFVKHLALCLAGAQLDGWSRAANLTTIGQWPHGALTPIYVELRRFVTSAHFPADSKTLPSADHLWHYIEADLLGEELHGYSTDLKLDLEQGQAVLILDGLDEVPYPENHLEDRRKQLKALVESLNTRYRDSRVIVASRPYAYEGWKLPGFEAITIADFEDNHRRDLASRLYRLAGLSDDDATTKATALNNQLRAVDPALKDRPLFLTLMATLFLRNEGEGLPTRRGALYRQSILLLLQRWTQSKPGVRALPDILGTASLDDLYQRLAALAYEVHSSFGDRPGTPEIEEALLYKHLKPMGRSVAAELIPYLSENAGVLVSPGQDTERDVFHFAHRTFQEYLAAAHIASLCLKADSYQPVRDLIQSKPQTWREPCALIADVLTDTAADEHARMSDLWRLVDHLLPDDPPKTLATDDPRCWSVWLAAAITEEQHLANLVVGRAERAVRLNLVGWLVKLVETAKALEPPERAGCGRALGLLGDPRPGVGLREDRLPNILWGNEVSARTYIIGEDEQANDPLPEQTYTVQRPYRMAKYLITYAQFQAFLDDQQTGFNDDRWWEGLTAEHRKQPMNEQAFPYLNHPRERVSWYQAVAFCRWLNWKYREAGLLPDGYEIRLPTEQEWEIAARYPDGRHYPWGESYSKGNANVSEGNGEYNVGQTTAVGLYPQGCNPELDLYDLSGNVWEWCLNEYSHPENVSPEGTERRVLRGGSWNFAVRYARAASRGRYFPGFRSYDFGFRVVCAPLM